MKLKDFFQALNTQEMLNVNGGGYYDSYGYWHDQDHSQGGSTGGSSGGGNTDGNYGANNDEGYFNGYDTDYGIGLGWLSDKAYYDLINHQGCGGGGSGHGNW